MSIITDIAILKINGQYSSVEINEIVGNILSGNYDYSVLENVPKRI